MNCVCIDIDENHASLIEIEAVKSSIYVFTDENNASLTEIEASLHDSASL